MNVHLLGQKHSYFHITVKPVCVKRPNRQNKDLNDKWLFDEQFCPRRFSEAHTVR